MKLTIKHYGNKLFGTSYFMVPQEFDVSIQEAEGMWTSFDLGDMENLNEDEIQIKLQEKIDSDFNRWERNTMDRGSKNIDRFFALTFGNETDGSERFSSEDSSEENDYLDAEASIYRALPKKPEWAQIIIDHVLYEETFRSIAKRTGQSEDNVSAKYQRAIKKLQKLFPDHRIFDIGGRS